MKGKNLIHCVKYHLGVDHSVTQTSKIEQHAMRSYLSGSKLLVEIGVYEGFNTKEFALYSPVGAVIYAIDPFLKNSFGICYQETIAVKEWEKNNVRDKIKIVKGFSWNVDYLIPDNIDFLFIDGDHSFEGVTKDFNLYEKKMSPKGTIAFHDARVFHNGWTDEDWGPVRLVKQIVNANKDWKVIEEVDSLVLMQRHAA